MNINSLSIPYHRQSIPVQAVPASADSMDRPGNNIAERSLVVQHNHLPSRYLRPRTGGEVELGAIAGDGQNDNPLPEKGTDHLLNSFPRQRNWDYKLLSWFRTVFTMQGNIYRNKGVHIHIIV
jgi:hypothetical protein